MIGSLVQGGILGLWHNRMTLLSKADSPTHLPVLVTDHQLTLNIANQAVLWPQALQKDSSSHLVGVNFGLPLVNKRAGLAVSAEGG